MTYLVLHKILFINLIVGSIGLFLGCSDKVAGTVETGNTGTKQVSGIFVYENGERVANAKVTVRLANILADTSEIEFVKITVSDTFSTTTNDSGAYTIDSGALDPGIYVVEGDDEAGNLVLIDSVEVLEAQLFITVPEDTLKPAGAIKGIINLSEGGDPQGVLVLAFGIDRFARVNDDGSFKFEGLAEAKYDLRLMPTITAGQYGILDIFNVGVISGDTTDLDTLNLLFEGIPIPKNLHIEYDTLFQIVTLNWDKADTNLIKGYNIYRKHSDSDFVKQNIKIIDDIKYIDTSGIQGNLYEYKLTSIDYGDNESLKSNGKSINIVGAYKLLQTYGNGVGSGNTYFNKLTSITSDANGNIFCGDGLNFRVQKFDSLGNFLTSWGQRGTAEGEFEDRITDLTVDSKGDIYVLDNGNNRIQKFSNSGIFIKEWLPTGSEFQGLRRIFIRDSLVLIGSNSGIQIFDLNGEHLKTITEIENSPNPDGIVLLDSIIYVSQHNQQNKILKYHLNGQFLDTLFSEERSPEFTEGFDDLIINQKNTFLYVVKRHRKQIRVFDINGNELFMFYLDHEIDYQSYMFSLYALSDNSILVSFPNGFFQKYNPVISFSYFF